MVLVAKFRLDQNYSFIHIPKCAGASLIAEYFKFLPGSTHKTAKNPTGFWPPMPQGTNFENCIAIDVRDRPTSARLVFLRSPFTHVFSQYTECRFDSWGKKVTSAYPEFPRDDSRPLLDEFGQWVAFFIRQQRYKQQNGKPLPVVHVWHNKNTNQSVESNKTTAVALALGCYNPRNMQARHMTCEAHAHAPLNAHFRQPGAPLINVESALQNLHRSVAYVGIVELASTSLCLFVLQATSSLRKSHTVFETLFETCKCTPDGRTTSLMQVKKVHTHHAAGHGYVQWQQHLVDRVAELVHADIQVYEHELKDFVGRVKATEAAIKYRFMCDDMIGKAQHLLEHHVRAGLGGRVNISQMYHST